MVIDLATILALNFYLDPTQSFCFSKFLSWEVVMNRGFTKSYSLPWRGGAGGAGGIPASIPQQTIE